MPFALIPDGYKLQKVSKLQKEAVDKFYSSKNIDSFLNGQASGELVKTAAIVVTPIVLAFLAKQLIEEAKNLNIDLPNATKEELIYLGRRLNPVTLPIDIALSLAAGLTGNEELEKQIREILPIL